MQICALLRAGGDECCIDENPLARILTGAISAGNPPSCRAGDVTGAVGPPFSPRSCSVRREQR
jgi:hypothetical protein